MADKLTGELRARVGPEVVLLLDNNEAGTKAILMVKIVLQRYSQRRHRPPVLDKFKHVKHKVKTHGAVSDKKALSANTII